MSDEMRAEMGAAFWQFSTTLYAARGIEPALLALQDRDGFEVNLALFCLFAAQRRIHLDAPAIEAMRAVGLAWGHEVVGHLRTARRLMKPRAIEDKDAARLRDEVKVIELAAERAMQGALADLLIAIDGPLCDEPSRAIAAANFAAWFAAEGINGEAPREAVAMLVAAAFPA